MEGVSSEASSLAGHLQLGNLIAVWDDNHISIDGDTNCAFTEDVAKRYEAYGWHVVRVEQGDSDLARMAEALKEAQAVKDKPTLIQLTTTIGFGSTQQGTHGVHGSPLKPDDIRQLKEKFGFNPDKNFDVPQEVYDAYAQTAAKGAAAEAEWNQLLAKYAESYPAEHKDLLRRLKSELPEGWEKALPVYSPSDAAVATRKLSETVLSKIESVVPELLGGSADLTGSNLTRWKGAVDFQPAANGLGDYSGRYIRFGVREHGMGAIMNGLAAYGTVLPYGGTFLNFVSYGAGSVRLSSLSRVRVVWVATHDSIGLGEDGPTHQPIETLAHFRALPNCMVWRPADGNETSAAYKVVLTHKDCPSILALSRQNLPQLEGSTIEKASLGGYVLQEVEGAQISLLSTGSEVSICVEAAKYLADNHGIKARVVSMPCFEVFDSQPKDYKLSVLPDGIPSLSVEVMSTMGWEKYTHEQFGLNRFGASGPYKDVYKVRYSHISSELPLRFANNRCRSSSSPPRAFPSARCRRSTSGRTLLPGRPSTVLLSRSSKRTGSATREENKVLCLWFSFMRQGISCLSYIEYRKRIAERYHVHACCPIPPQVFDPPSTDLAVSEPGVPRQSAFLTSYNICRCGNGDFLVFPSRWDSSLASGFAEVVFQRGGPLDRSVSEPMQYYSPNLCDGLPIRSPLLLELPPNFL